MPEYGANDGPLGKAPDIEIGASDAVLLAVSFVGFCMLAWSVKNIVLARLKTAQELEEEAEQREISYGEQLARADVSTLNRAQRRARAKHIMKQQRRVAPLPGAVDGDGDGNQAHGEAHDEPMPAWDSPHAGGHHNLLSRKERQKAAKQVELQERRLLEADRRIEQRKAQEAAVQRKKEKERLNALQAEKDRIERRNQKEAEELAGYRAWKTFLKTENHEYSVNGTDVVVSGTAISVREWIQELRYNRIVYLQDLADRFRVTEDAVYDRIQGLIDAGRLSGILEKADGNKTEDPAGRARFLYLPPETMSELASFVKAQEQITPEDFARHLQEQWKDPSAE